MTGIDVAVGRMRANASCVTTGITTVVSRLRPQDIITNKATFGFLRQKPKANTSPAIHTTITGNEKAHWLIACVIAVVTAFSVISIAYAFRCRGRRNDAALLQRKNALSIVTGHATHVWV